MPDVEAMYPLSPQQQGMLFESLASPVEGLFVEQLTYEVPLPLDVEALRTAWQLLVDRHEALRAALVWRDQSAPLQVVMRRPETAVAVVDLGGSTAADGAARLHEFLLEDRRQGFDLGQAPLTRLSLVLTGEREQHLVWTQHHVLMDGWCVPVLLEELIAAYAAACRGRPVELPPVPPYRNYLAWLATRDFAQAELFWRRELDGVSAPTPLGRVEAEARELGSGHGDEHLDLGTKLTRRLEELARARRVTVSSLVSALWAVLLARYSGRDDVVLGSTVSGRPAEVPGIERMIGLFMTTLPLRLEVRRMDAFWDWVGDVQARQVAVRRFEYCSPAQVHAWSGQPGSAPLFESVLIVENYPVPKSDGKTDLDGGFVGARTRYPLNLLVLSRDSLRLDAIYDESRLDQRGVRQRLEHLRRVAVRAADDPETSIAELLAAIGDSEIPSVRSLQASDRRRPPHVPPRSQTERALADIWSELLAVELVGRDDDFFALGGQSLVATQLLGRLRRAYAIDLPLRTVFEARTLGALATAVEEAVLRDIETRPADLEANV